MDASETSASSDTQVDDSEDILADALKIPDSHRELRIKNDALVAELEALRDSYCKLQAKTAAMEENVVLLERQKDEALKHNTDLSKAIEELSGERDALRDELRGLSSRERENELEMRIDEELKEKEGIRGELEDCRERIRELLDERSEKIKVFSEKIGSLKSVKDCLVRVIASLDEDKVESFVDEGEEMRGETESDEELRPFFIEIKLVSKLASTVEMKLSEYQEIRKKETRELENSVVSLTEENRDINTLLRIALVEKEAVEKSLNKLKGNNEQKRGGGAILQIAERGLQRVGFGFMIGAGTNEPASENSGSNTGSKSDGSECEEEVVSLVLLCFSL